MKKALIFACALMPSAANAQLEKGNTLAGLQFNLSEGGIYYNYPEFSFSNGRYRYSINITPAYGIALERNWVLGGQATFGYSRGKDDFAVTIIAYDKFTELGIGPFTRLYLDLSPNGKVKLYGLGALELSYRKEKFWNTANGNSTVVSLYTVTRFDAALGFGLGYFGNRLAVDMNVSNLGLRLGFYFPSINRKKQINN